MVHVLFLKLAESSSFLLKDIVYYSTRSSEIICYEFARIPYLIDKIKNHLSTCKVLGYSVGKFSVILMSFFQGCLKRKFNKRCFYEFMHYAPAPGTVLKEARSGHALPPKFFIRIQLKQKLCTVL